MLHGFSFRGLCSKTGEYFAVMLPLQVSQLSINSLKRLVFRDFDIQCTVVVSSRYGLLLALNPVFPVYAEHNDSETVQTRSVDNCYLFVCLR